jgi:hypothetical protein
MLGSRTLTGTPLQYAAVMALGASRLGVPARLVTGATPGRRGIVEYTQVGVWVELQLADGTWHTLEERRYTGAEIVSEEEPDDRVDDTADFVAGVVGGSGTGRGGLTRGGQDPAPDERPNDEDPAAREPDPVPAVGLRTLAGVVAAAALAALLLVPLAKLVRRARRRRTSSWSGIYVNAWQEVLDASRDLGTPIPDTWSRMAQARRLGTGLELARRADANVFAPRPGLPEDGREFWDDCQDLRRGLVKQAAARRRAWSWFNPASLLAGWARPRSSRGSVAQVRDEDRGARRQQPAGA